MEEREGLTRRKESQIKCTAGLNMHGEWIKVIDKSNMHAGCALWKSIETWEHVVMCGKI